MGLELRFCLLYDDTERDPLQIDKFIVWMGAVD